MITSIELGDFLAHSDTKLELENGVTVFVGDNGAGKSSIIDAITFALFGRHTRKSNKSLIKRGLNQGFTKIGFKPRLFRLSVDALGSKQAANFAIKELLPILVSGEIKEASQIIIDNFEKFKKEKK